MHELSLCNSIQQVVNRAAGDRTVTVVHLRLGRLRQVVPDTLRYCWDLVTADSPLAGSELAIESVAVSARCNACAAGTTIADTLVLLCCECGSPDLELLTGEEFLITTLDLADSGADLG
ncbi:hydrogenase maturation nickel metallochaperone HypA/HybF [Nocardioides pelophilus]|uniref:hydrogenase maturation nickel metallochaperone HypA/HybF n=1 Tax=Nocardioides pelophilus TaxID=2172019 RepID=UPI0016029DDB|nr:hydrogenase maturation nickel metallochaperone HypA [Nocardioides pelophilus]